MNFPIFSRKKINEKRVKTFLIHIKTLHTMVSIHQKLKKPPKKFSRSGFEPDPYRGATPIKVLGMPFQGIFMSFQGARVKISGTP